jgi:hypothetical protein
VFGDLSSFVAIFPYGVYSFITDPLNNPPPVQLSFASLLRGNEDAARLPWVSMHNLVQQLDLGSNCLTRLPDGLALLDRNQLTTLQLRGNPLDASCSDLVQRCQNEEISIRELLDARFGSLTKAAK